MGYFAQIQILVICGGEGENEILLEDTWVFNFTNENWMDVS